MSDEPTHTDDDEPDDDDGEDIEDRWAPPPRKSERFASRNVGQHRKRRSR